MKSDIIIIILIAVLFIITVVSLAASFILRKKQGSAPQDVYVYQKPETDKNLDADFEACIGEINKLGTLIRSELDTKYKELLFLYGLIDEKLKEINELVEKGEKTLAKSNIGDVAMEPPLPDPAPEPENPGFVLVGEKEWGNANEEVNPPPAKVQKTRKPPRFINEAHKKIWEMFEGGREVPEIARELGIGQGEVTLILNIAAS